MYILIFLLFFSTITFAKVEKNPNRIPFSDSVLVITTNESTAVQLSKKFSSKTKIIDFYQNYLILKIGPTNKNLFSALASTPGVTQVLRGLRLSYQNDDKACETTINKKATQKAFIKEVQCLGGKSCLPSSRTRLWAQKAMATDLAQKYLADKKIPRVTKIGVIDSGFDLRLAHQLDSENKIQVKPAVTSSTDYHLDPIGHGTRVASMIKGIDGVGGSTKSPLTMYGLGVANTSIAEISNAVLRACDDGNQIINVSMAGDGFGGVLQRSLSSEMPEEIVKKLHDKGCIIVHAAGNDGASRSTSPMSNFEPQIGATNSYGNISNFSSRGDFYVPGKNVVGLNAGSQHNHDDIDNCIQASQSFSSGTSFSAPLFTSHLALVRDMLMTSKKFTELSTDKQTAMLINLSQVSRVGDNVNTYLAVKIAEIWVKNEKDGDISDAEIRFKKENEKICSKPPIVCKDTENNCIDNSKCEDSARERALNCREKSPEQEIKLVQLHERQNDLEGATYWRQEFNRQFPEQKMETEFPIETMKLDLDSNSNQAQVSRWVNYYSTWKKTTLFDSEEVKTFLAPIAQRSLSNSFELIGREKKMVARSDVAQLYVGMKKSGLADSDTTKTWINKIRKNEKLRNFYLESLIQGINQKLVSQSEISQVIETLTETSATSSELESGSILLDALTSKVDTEKYVSNIVSNPATNDKILSKVIAKVHSDNLNDWIQFADGISKKPQIGPVTADNILIVLYMERNKFDLQNKEKVKTILSTLSKVPGKHPISDTMISEIQKELP